VFDWCDSLRRSRDCETTISVDYLKALAQGYEEFLSHISKLIPVIRVNWSKYRTAEVRMRARYDDDS
jgi:hypothetical protein